MDDYVKSSIGSRASANTLDPSVSPVARLTHRVGNVIARIEEAFQAQHRSLDRLSGDAPPMPDTSMTTPREAFSFGGELADLEMTITRLEDVAKAAEYVANRVTRIA